MNAVTFRPKGNVAKAIELARGCGLNVTELIHEVLEDRLLKYAIEKGQLRLKLLKDLQQELEMENRKTIKMEGA